MRARNPQQLSNRRGTMRLRLLMTVLIGAAFVGCEESQACFPINTDCSDAAGFSLFFEANVPCCEGVCTDQPPTPENPNIIPKLCE